MLAAPVSVTRPRLDSIDFVRGMVMVIMTLDHARDFFTNATVDPMNVGKTWTALYLTRWVTHFCAPVFCFLAGTGAYLYGQRHTRGELAWFLLTRGLWLALLELTLSRAAWIFSFDYTMGAAVGVLWSLGWSMVALAALIWLPTTAVAAFGLVMIAAHNLFDGIQPEAWGRLGWLWGVLHVCGSTVEPVAGWRLFILYPLVPWIGVMAAGYGFGAFYRLEPAARRAQLIGLGGILILAFFAVRWANLHGDLYRWEVQESPVRTAFAFFNCHKYPPSLCYLLMTLGPAIVLLGLADGWHGPLIRPLVIIGRVPLFYYLLHVALIHALWLGCAYARLGKLPQWVWVPGGHAEHGYNLPGVYLAWAVTVLLMYPLCYWFAGLKQRSRAVWLSYL